ncbi:MAG: cbb3-type cytochrome c oxidase subunit 3 [Bosea sp. (in: a-proteobacteria)]
MIETYAFLTHLAQSAGLLYFMAIFCGMAIYAFWPSNKSKFDHAAAIPLSDD